MPKSNLTAIGLNPIQGLHFNTSNIYHPEHPNRIDVILKRLESSGILKECQIIQEFLPLKDGLLESIHSKELLEQLETLKSLSQEEINTFANSFDSVSLTKNSFEVAVNSAECVIGLTELLIEDKIDNGFAIIRPPGHHAQRLCCNGFCVLNNVSLAAKHAKNLGVKRILIVDFDVHHGQGTQSFFYDSNSVLYFSTHRYEDGAFWPHLRESDFDCIGENDGLGFNINVPINEKNVGNVDFMHIFWTLLYPIAVKFQPELILYSAGFDSCAGDPVGQFNLTPDLYACWIYHLKAICPKQLLLLEGGYNHKVQALCVQTCLDVLLGRNPSIQFSNRTEIQPRTLETCHNCIQILKPYWPNLDSSNSLNSIAKSTYSVPTKSPPNTGDIHQDSLDIPFDVNKYEKRLNYPKIFFVFENEETMKRVSPLMERLSLKFEIESSVHSLYKQRGKRSALTVLVNLKALYKHIPDAFVVVDNERELIWHLLTIDGLSVVTHCRDCDLESFLL